MNCFMCEYIINTLIKALSPTWNETFFADVLFSVHFVCIRGRDK